MNFGEKLKKLMDEKKIRTAEVLSKQLEEKGCFISPNTIRNYTKGRAVKRTDIYGELANFFGVSTQYLMDDSVQNKQKEDLDFGEVLGLSDGAIETLKSFKNKSIINNINELIESDFMENLMFSINKIKRLNLNRSTIQSVENTILGDFEVLNSNEITNIKNKLCNYINNNLDMIMTTATKLWEALDTYQKIFLKLKNPSDEPNFKPFIDKIKQLVPCVLEEFNNNYILIEYDVTKILQKYLHNIYTGEPNYTVKELINAFNEGFDSISTTRIHEEEMEGDEE